MSEVAKVDKLEEMLLEILEDGDNLETLEDKVEWTVNAIKALALVDLDNRSDIKSMRNYFKIILYGMMPIIASLVTAIIALVR